MYKVTVRFLEQYDDYRSYEVGDMYPRDGFTPPEGRIQYLSSGDTVSGKPHIAKVREEKVVQAKTEDEDI